MARPSEVSKVKRAKAFPQTGGLPTIKPLAHHGGGAQSVTVSVDNTVYEIEGLQRGGVSQLMKTISRGAVKGMEAGVAEFTVRFTRDGAVTVSDIRTLAAEPERASAVITTRPPENEAAFAAARERGRHRVAEILERPEMLSAEAIGERLGLSRVAVNDRRQRREFLGLEGTKRGFKYPDWQIGENGKPLEALPKLFDLLGDSPWAVYRFLVQPHAALEGRSALEVLREGRSEPVLDAAESFARGDFG